MVACSQSNRAFKEHELTTKERVEACLQHSMIRFSVRSLSLTYLLHKGLKARILSDAVEVAVLVNLIQEL